jgi:hypothetical protein
MIGHRAAALPGRGTPLVSFALTVSFVFPRAAR